MQDEARKKITAVIEDNKRAIKAPEPKDALAADPSVLEQSELSSRKHIALLLAKLQSWHADLLPFVRNLRKHVQDITEGTHLCAIYLVLCHLFDNWVTAFDIAQHGKSPALGNLMRFIKEDEMLVSLFAIEAHQGKRANLDKWLAGNIVSHATGRDVTSEFFDAHSIAADVDLAKLSAHIYQVESQGTHPSYASMLELVSPFTEDYDFTSRTQLFRTTTWLRYALGSMTACNIALKSVYGLLLNNEKSYQAINDTLMKYDPSARGPINPEAIKGFQKATPKK